MAAPVPIRITHGTGGLSAVGEGLSNRLLAEDFARRQALQIQATDLDRMRSHESQAAHSNYHLQRHQMNQNATLAQLQMEQQARLAPPRMSAPAPSPTVSALPAPPSRLEQAMGLGMPRGLATQLEAADMFGAKGVTGQLLERAMGLQTGTAPEQQQGAPESPFSPAQLARYELQDVQNARTDAEKRVKELQAQLLAAGFDPEGDSLQTQIPEDNISPLRASNSRGLRGLGAVTDWLRPSRDGRRTDQATVDRHLNAQKLWFEMEKAQAEVAAAAEQRQSIIQGRPAHSAQTAPGANLPIVNSKADFDRLASGDRFLELDPVTGQYREWGKP